MFQIIGLLSGPKVAMAIADVNSPGDGGIQGPPWPGPCRRAVAAGGLSSASSTTRLEKSGRLSVVMEPGRGGQMGPWLGTSYKASRGFAALREEPVADVVVLGSRQNFAPRLTRGLLHEG